MSSTPWVGHPDIQNFDVLQIPSYAQPDGENECILYSMWMVLQYAKNSYPEQWVREETNALAVSEIGKHLTIRQAGWVPDEDELISLSEETSPIEFEHVHWDSPPAGLPYEVIEDKLEQFLPTIAIIDARQLRKGISNDGPMHAVVVTGVDNTRIAINDPWGYHYDVVERSAFKEAWDARISQLVKVNLGRQSTIQTSETEGQR